MYIYQGKPGQHMWEQILKSRRAHLQIGMNFLVLVHLPQLQDLIFQLEQLEVV